MGRVFLACCIALFALGCREQSPGLESCLADAQIAVDGWAACLDERDGARDLMNLTAELAARMARELPPEFLARYGLHLSGDWLSVEGGPPALRARLGVTGECRVGE